jgi:hypothetical protein
MTELYPTDAQLNALSGTSDSEQEVLFVTTGESPYYTSFYKMLQRLLNVARRAGDLRAYKDGDLTFGVRAGRFMNGPVAVNYAGAGAQALADNSINYVYMTSAGVLAVNQTGFPDPSLAPHVPLATIGTGSQSAAAIGGKYDQSDITDYRGRGMFKPVDVHRWVLFGNTSGATPGQLTLDGNPAGAANRIVLPDACAMSLQINIVAKVAGTGACSQFLRQALVVSQAGSASIVGTPAVIGADNNAPAFAVSITADNTAHALDIAVTGAAGASVNWAATVCAGAVATGS